jgi:hypothetical protein
MYVIKYSIRVVLIEYILKHRVCLVARVVYLTSTKLSSTMPPTYKCVLLCCVW